jgi:hypothetical protein
MILISNGFSNRVVAGVLFLPNMYVNGVCITLATMLSRRNKNFEKKDSIEVFEKETFIKKLKKKITIKKFKNVLSSTWNSPIVQLARKTIYIATPIVATGIIIYVFVKPAVVRADEFAYEYLEYPQQEVQETFYQRTLKRLKPLASYGNAFIKVSSIFNTMEYTVRSYVLLQQRDYLGMALSVGQLGLNCSTLAFGELSEQATNAEEKFIYSGLQKTSLALSTSLKLSDPF